MFNVNSKIQERHQWCRSGIFIVNFLIYFTPFSSVSVVNFEQLNAGWVITFFIIAIITFPPLF